MPPKSKPEIDAIAALNRIFAEVLGQGRRKNSLIYWSAPKGWKRTRYVFGYTPWKTRDPDTGKKGYFTLKYRELKNGNCKLVKSVRFGRRKVAKQRALDWYNQHYGKPSFEI